MAAARQPLSRHITDALGVRPRAVSIRSFAHIGTSRPYAAAVPEMSSNRPPRQGKVVRIEDGEAGLSARTIARRALEHRRLVRELIVRGDAGLERSPVSRGMAGRRVGQRGRGGVLLVRRPHTMPRALSPVEVDALLGALRTQRDRAIVLAMLLGGLLERLDTQAEAS